MTMDDVGILFLHSLADSPYVVGYAYCHTLSQSVGQQTDVTADEWFGFRIDKQDFHKMRFLMKLCGVEQGGGGASQEVLP